MNTTPILSTKLTSKNIQVSSHAGFLDKLFLDAKSISMTKLDYINHFKSLKFRNYDDGNFKGSRELRLEITTPLENKIYLKYRYHSEKIYQIVINPSVYVSYKQLINDMEIIASKELIETLPIQRIDKTVDIAIGLHEVHRGLEVRNKRSSKVFESMSGRVKNIQLGKKPETIKIYDRQRKEGHDFPCSRIEVSCTSTKVEFPNLKEMEATYKSNNQYLDQSFKGLTLNDVSYLKHFSLRQLIKQMVFEVLIQNMPYCLARSMLNRSGNFNRDYKKLIRLKPWQLQPIEILNTGLRNFFNDNALGEENG